MSIALAGPYRYRAHDGYRDTTNGSHASGSCSSAACAAAAIASARIAGASCRAFEAGGDLLQRVARRDLRVAPLVHVLADALDRRCARTGPLDLEHLEPRAVDRLERQLRLEARVGTRCPAPRPPAARARDRGRRGSTGSTGGGTGWKAGLATEPDASRLSASRQAGHSAFGRLPSSSPPGNVIHSPSTTCAATWVGSCAMKRV